MTKLNRLTLLTQYGLIDRGNGTIYDTKTNLTWQQDFSPEKYTWKDANRYCEELNLSGHKDWRLPTLEELKSLIEKGMPTICPIFNCEFFSYWSSWDYVTDPGYTWVINFYDGYVHCGYKANTYYIRAVRTGL
jgi:hypothetical protein